MTNRRARVKVVKDSTVTRTQAAAEFSRKKAKQRRKQHNRRILLVGAFALLAYMIIGGWWLFHTGKIDKAVQTADVRFWQWTATSGFRLDQVMLTGRVHADPKAVKTALDIHQGEPILGLPLAEMKQRLETIPEVKTAVVYRTLPNTLHVAITERTPAAIWQSNGNLQLIDRDGIVLPHDTYHDKGNMLLVVGSDAPKHMAELITLLDSAPGLKTDVVAAIRVGDRRWNIQLQHDIVVMLPEDAPSDAWKRFATLVQTKNLLSKAIRSVDMRMEDRVFIMPVEEKKSLITLTNARDT